MDNDNMPRKMCRKCLLKEMMESGDFYKTLKANIDAIAQQDRASEALYEERLSVCKGCDYLADGLCRACGCYVEYRGAKKDEVCPYKKW